MLLPGVHIVVVLLLLVVLLGVLLVARLVVRHRMGEMDAVDSTGRTIVDCTAVPVDNPAGVHVEVDSLGSDILRMSVLGAIVLVVAVLD